MNGCPDVEAIERACDGRADATARAAWAAHAATCDACRKLGDEIAANLAAAARWGRWHGAEQPEVPPEVPGVVVHARLAAGGQGVVWRGVQTATQRPVAIKTIRSSADAQARARFAREARLGARLRHPQLVTVLDAGATATGELYLVMELVAGETLEAALGRGLPSVAEALQGFVAIADGVRFAHQHGVLHRDLKPGNILRTDGGSVRILDFGLAKALDEVAPDAHATLEGMFVGTLACAAPEQLRFDGAPVDVRTDLFQLGVVFYRYLTGTWPHTPAADPRAMLARRLHELPQRPSRLRPELPADGDAILMRLLAPEPERRYATANELHGDLERLQRGEPIAARAEEARVWLAQLVRRYRAAMLAAAAIVAVLAFAVWLVVGYARQAGEDRAAIAREFARAEELLGILTRSMDAMGGGTAGPKTPMVDFLDGVVAELETRPAVDANGRADLLVRAASLYARIADPEQAARFVTRALDLVGRTLPATGTAAGDAQLLLRAHALELRLVAAVLDPAVAVALPPLLRELEGRFGPASEQVLRLRILEQLAVRADREPEAALATLRELAARVAALPAGEPTRERLQPVLDYTSVAVAAAAGARDEALARGRALLAQPVGDGYPARLRRFAILQLVCPMAMDTGELELAEATTAEFVRLAAELALPSDPRRAAALFTRGLCLVRLSRFAEAKPLLREFLTLVDGGAAAEPRRVALACALLATAARTADDFASPGARDESIAWLARARGVLRELGPDSENDLLQVEQLLGDLLLQGGRGDEALPVLEAALELARRRVGQPDAGARITAIEALLARARRN